MAPALMSSGACTHKIECSSLISARSSVREKVGRWSPLPDNLPCHVQFSCNTYYGSSKLRSHVHSPTYWIYEIRLHIHGCSLHFYWTQVLGLFFWKCRERKLASRSSSRDVRALFQLHRAWSKWIELSWLVRGFLHLSANLVLVYWGFPPTSARYCRYPLSVFSSLESFPRDMSSGRAGAILSSGLI